MRQTKQVPRRMLAWLLTLTLIFGVFPTSAFAVGNEAQDSSSSTDIITTFAPLDELTENQYWGVGTDISELILPDKLSATVTSGAAIVVSLAEEDEDDVITQDEITPQKEDIAVLLIPRINLATNQAAYLVYLAKKNDCTLSMLSCVDFK